MTSPKASGCDSIDVSNAKLREVFTFLLGEGPLDDMWFGDSDTSRPRPRFWWRKHLRRALIAAASASRAQPAGATDTDRLDAVHKHHMTATKELADAVHNLLNFAPHVLREQVRHFDSDMAEWYRRVQKVEAAAKAVEQPATVAVMNRGRRVVRTKPRGEYVRFCFARGDRSRDCLLVVDYKAVRGLRGTREMPAEHAYGDITGIWIEGRDSSGKKWRWLGSQLSRAVEHERLQKLING